MELQYIFRYETNVIQPCRGDSGGPLACRSTSGDKWVLIGATSFGPKNCLSGELNSVYTRISSYVGWINNKIFPDTALTVTTTKPISTTSGGDCATRSVFTLFSLLVGLLINCHFN